MEKLSEKTMRAYLKRATAILNKYAYKIEAFHLDVYNFNLGDACDARDVRKICIYLSKGDDEGDSVSFEISDFKTRMANENVFISIVTTLEGWL